MTMADTHEQIILTPDPRGRKIEGYISGTPKPGTVMQLKAATEPVNGKFTYEIYNRSADSDRPQGPIYVLLQDELQGKTVDDAYASGDLGQLYCPLPGDELLMLVAKAGTGTGDAIAIGDIFIIDDGTGVLLATTSTPETEPFAAMETMTDVVAGGTLTHCVFSGY